VRGIVNQRQPQSIKGSHKKKCLLKRVQNEIKRDARPPRHLHHDQEEWFYAIEGEYLLEIGDERFELGPGDSVLAPRKVPHVWAFKGKGHCRHIIAFQPAGLMEFFFQELAKINGVPAQEELQRLFHMHGMEINGPPIALIR
jgi:mannose-6-phosphate isomerase-like protein (cupin superfamily)